jgi:hypothetical protein
MTATPERPGIVVRRASEAFVLAASTARTLVSHLPVTVQATRVRANATTFDLAVDTPRKLV